MLAWWEDKCVEKKKIILMIGLVLIAIALPLGFNNSYLSHILFMTVYYAFLSSSWNLVGGFAGQLAIGNGVYVGIGLYITIGFFMGYGVSPWIGILLAALLTGLVSMILGCATFRLSGSYYGLSTVALLNILRIWFSENDRLFGLFFGGSAGVRVTWIGGWKWMEFVDKNVYYFIMLALLLLLLVGTYWMSKSKFGYYLLAISTNQNAAASLGVNVYGNKLIAQFISAFLMAIGGGIYGMFIIYTDPQTIFSFQVSFNIMLMAVFGGRGTVFGPLIGSIILTPFYELLRINLSTVLPGLPMALYGLMLMLCMQFMPKGFIDTVLRAVGVRKLKTFQSAHPQSGGEENEVGRT